MQEKFRRKTAEISPLPSKPLPIQGETGIVVLVCLHFLNKKQDDGMSGNLKKGAVQKNKTGGGVCLWLKASLKRTIH
jgi:hypothetical protein